MAAFPVIKLLTTVNLYRYFRTDCGAGSTAGAVSVFFE
jgi:hypothetical protein